MTGLPTDTTRTLRVIGTIPRLDGYGLPRVGCYHRDMWHTMPQGARARWLAGARELERALAAIGCAATLLHVGSRCSRDRQLANAILGQVDRAKRAVAVQQGEIGAGSWWWSNHEGSRVGPRPPTNSDTPGGWILHRFR